LLFRQWEDEVAWFARVARNFIRPLASEPQESRRESFRVSGAPVSGRVVSKKHNGELVLTSNLLPPKEKEEVRYEEIRLIMLVFAYSTTAVLAMGLIFLFPSFLSLTFEKGEFDRSLKIEEEAALNFEIKDSKSRISAIKAELSLIAGYIPNASRASAIIGDIFADAPAGINIQEIRVGKDGALAVSGVAGTRRDLLNFEKNLRDSGRTQELKAPVPVKEFEINFNLQGKLKSMYGLWP